MNGSCEKKEWMRRLGVEIERKGVRKWVQEIRRGRKKN